MRVDRLDLTRYGKFTDAILPLEKAGSGTFDLHIVYGDNEAGKTTTLNAFLDLIFGIEASTPYKFLHQPTVMRIGGVLEVGGEKRGVIRLPKLGLLDEEERPLPEGLFSGDLAGLDRATYKNMFLLDEKTLEAGGESILSSQGDLGQLLFSATAGLSDFTTALAGLKVEADIFYKVHGRKHGLADFKKQLATLKERRAAIDVTAAPFAKLIAAREDARIAYDAAIIERGRLQAETNKVRRLLVTLPRLTEWARLRADCNALPDVPPVPQDWAAELSELRKSFAALAARQAASDDEIERLNSEIKSLPIDEAALSIATRVKKLEDSRARFATAAKDLPDRRAALRAAEKTVSNLLCDLDRPDHAAPRELLLRPSVVTRLRQKLEDLSGLAAAQREAASELSDAQAREQRLRASLADTHALPDDHPGLVNLRYALSATESDDSLARLRLAERACRTHAGTLADRVAALKPWQGNADTLAELDLPERVELERLEKTLLEAERRRSDSSREVNRLRVDIRRLSRVREELAADHQSIDDEAAASSRAARDNAWSAHLSGLDVNSARTFEAAMRADDAIVRARFAQTGSLGELRTLNRSLATAVADLEIAEERLDSADFDHRSVLARAVLRASPFVGQLEEAPLSALEVFLSKRDRALEARRQLREAEDDRTCAALEVAQLIDRLAGALAAVDASTPTERTVAALTSAARAFLDAQSAADALRERAESASRETLDRRQRVLRADEAMRDWHKDWEQTLQATWLAGERDIGRIRDVLVSLADLGPALDIRDGLEDRVSKMEADVDGFVVEVRQVASVLGIADDTDIGEIADRLGSRTRRAAETAAARSLKLEDHHRVTATLSALRPEMEASRARIAEMTTRFGVETLDDLEVLFDAARSRADLDRRIDALEVEICGACDVASVEAAKELLASLNRDDLESRREELETLGEDQVTRSQEAFAALRSACDAVETVDGDAAAARLEEERRTILLEIEDRTLAHLSLRAGIIAAEGAISLYRDRHRSAMMECASGLFAHLTRGAYTGLAAQSAKEGEILVGLTSGGGSRLSSQMSTATRSQLYLALRMAAYREFVKSRRPLPFVLDDVLETFDDDRAEASLSLLTNMAKTGQVIYLTHHKHLCSIARRVCPDAKFHDLGTI